MTYPRENVLQFIKVLRENFDLLPNEEDTVSYLEKVLSKGQVIMRFGCKDNLICFLDYWRLERFKDKDEKPYPKDISEGKILYVNTFWVDPDWRKRLYWSVLSELRRKNRDAEYISWNNEKRNDRLLLRRLNAGAKV